MRVWAAAGNRDGLYVALNTGIKLLRIKLLLAPPERHDLTELITIYARILADPTFFQLKSNYFCKIGSHFVLKFVSTKK
jgi:hypothetical protein